jgi:hypothetical protein
VLLHWVHPAVIDAAHRIARRRGGSTKSSFDVRA